MKLKQAMKEIMKQKRKEALRKARLDSAFHCKGCDIYYANLPEEMIKDDLCHLCQEPVCPRCGLHYDRHLIRADGSEKFTHASGAVCETPPKGDRS